MEEYKPSGGERKAFRAEQEKAEAAANEGILPFTRTDEAIWQSCLDANTDGYGVCVLRYAARWANLMEKNLPSPHRTSAGTIGEIADRCSHEAGTEGITGFMYGCAVEMLAKCWTHGDALRRWHNLKTQIGHEGEEANKTGGVLNPALLRIAK